MNLGLTANAGLQRISELRSALAPMADELGLTRISILSICLCPPAEFSSVTKGNPFKAFKL